MPAKAEPKIVNEKSMMTIRFGYGEEIVVSVPAGNAIIAALEEAYTYVSDYGKEPIVKPLTTTIETKLLNGELYREYRRNYLLGVNNDSD